MVLLQKPQTSSNCIHVWFAFFVLKLLSGYSPVVVPLGMHCWLFIPLITYSVDIWFGSITLRNIIRIGQRPVLIQYYDVCMYVCTVM